MNNQTGILVKEIAKEMKRIWETVPAERTMPLAKGIDALAEMEFAAMLQAYYELKTT